MYRNLVRIIVKETWVGNTCVWCQCLDTSTWTKWWARLIEGNVSVRTDTTEEEVDTTCFMNHFLIVLALCLKIFCVTIQDMNVLLWTINVVEKILSHESVIALWMALWQTYILIHIECNNILKAYSAFFISLYQLSIHTLWWRTSRQTEYKWLVLVFSSIDTLNNIVCCPFW